jgi:methyl-accepting chemotaxis protein WspA
MTYYVSSEMLQSFADRRKSSLALIKATEVLSLIKDAETGQRGFVLTGQDAYLKPLENAEAALKTAIDELQTLANNSKVEHTSMAELRDKVNAKLAELDRTVELRRNQGFQAALDVVLTNEGKQVMDRIREILENVQKDEFAEQEKLNGNALRMERVFNLVLLVGIPVIGLIIIGLGLITARSISRPVNKIGEAASRIALGDLDVEVDSKATAEEIRNLTKSFASMVGSLRRSASLSERLAEGDLTVQVASLSDADVVGRAQRNMVDKLSELVEQVQRSGVQVNSSAIQIAATSKEQQSTATEMASTTTEISTTAKEMSATSTELLKAADTVNEVSQQLAGLASSGKEGLTRMESVMRQIIDASSAITSRLGEMNDKASNISSVVTTITKIADQTNLLSLNAAIEAEKAGEYGRGFSVVASEIRRLADQTAASTLDIEQMVKDMLGSVSAGVMGMDKFSEEVRRSAREVSDVSGQIDQMIEQVQSLAPSVESVYEGMRAQTQGATQISEALSQLGDAARQTAEAIRDSNRAVDQLNDATRGLQTSISRFRTR